MLHMVYVLKGLPKNEADDKAIEMLKMVHLSNYIDAYPHQLSGGMKQRVCDCKSTCYGTSNFTDG